MQVAEHPSVSSREVAVPSLQSGHRESNSVQSSIQRLELSVRGLVAGTKRLRIEDVSREAVSLCSESVLDYRSNSPLSRARVGGQQEPIHIGAGAPNDLGF